MKRYVIREVFDTLQGEGLRAGTRAVFVRFTGCNLWDGRPEHRDRGKGACALWCDTDFATGNQMTATELLSRMDAAWPEDGEPRWCVLTGGEPALQLDEDLLNALQNGGWKVAVETNGTVENEALQWCDWVCCSPKLGGGLVLERADELKVVLPGHVDPKKGWTEEDLVMLASVVKARYYIVNPMDPAGVPIATTHLLGNLPGAAPRFEGAMKTCLDFVRTHPNWRLGGQLHKLWHLP